MELAQAQRPRAKTPAGCRGTGPGAGRWLALLLGLLLVAAATAADAAERRVALVIGNGVYANVPVLANPDHDSAALAQGLRRIGFDVVELRHDLDRPAMARALQDFAREAR